MTTVWDLQLQDTLRTRSKLQKGGSGLFLQLRSLLPLLLQLRFLVLRGLL